MLLLLQTSLFTISDIGNDWIPLGHLIQLVQEFFFVHMYSCIHFQFWWQFQVLVGPVPQGYDSYFASRFPRLFMEVYKFVYKHCMEEECFQKYFKSNIDQLFRLFLIAQQPSMALVVYVIIYIPLTIIHRLFTIVNVAVI